MKSTILSCALILSGALTALSQDKADIVFVGEKIYTANPEMPWAKSMAVAGDTIIKVSETDECLKLVGPDTKVINAGGKTVMPGLIDTHLHTRLFGQTHATMLNLFKFNGRPVEVVEQAIRDWAAKLGPDEWLIGGGFSQAHFPKPTRQRLDELVGGRPALISDNSQHNGWYSTKALEILGIDENWTIPKGGYMPLGDDGKPTGHLQEKAHLSTGFVEQHKLYSNERQEEAVAKAAEMMNEVGVTSAVEAAGGSKEGSDDVYVRMAKKGTLTLRHDLNMVFWGGLAIREKDEAMIEQLVERRKAVREAVGSESDEFLTCNSVKFAIDGTPGAFAHMEVPYLDGTSANMNYEMENLKWIFDQLTERGFRLYLHVEGDAAIRKSLDALDYADATGKPLDPKVRHVFTHVDHASTSLVGRMKTREITVQLQYHWADATDEYFQANVSKNVPEFILQNSFNNHGMIVGSGIEYAAGADAPTSPIYKPVEQVEIAITRQAPGLPKSERLSGTSLTLEQALYGFMMGGAKLMYKESLIGSLEEGKKADIIVLDRDIHQQAKDDVYEVHQIRVLKTYLNGKLVHGDEDALIENRLPSKRTSIF